MTAPRTVECTPSAPITTSASTRVPAVEVMSTDDGSTSVRISSSAAAKAARPEQRHRDGRRAVGRPRTVERLDNLESGFLISRLCDCLQELNGPCTPC